MTNIYRPIPGWPGYFAGMDGTIVSAAKGKALVPQLNHKGYPRVRLHRGGKPKFVFVHKLITEAFLGERPPELQTLHADDDKLNNALVNLSYGTQVDNWADRRANGRTGWSERTHCGYGHEYTEDNVYRKPGCATRHCRECRRTKGREWKRKRRAARR